MPLFGSTFSAPPVGAPRGAGSGVFCGAVGVLAATLVVAGCSVDPVTLSRHDGGESTSASGQAESGLESCSLSSLPPEAEDTAEDILAGGPYEFPQNDNQRFGNYEGVLPEQASNYYREYTVETPGLNHRGPLRIVTGGGTETDPDVWYYTDDHYDSFCEIPDAE